LDDAWSFREAPRFADHPDASVRWAAAFALDQAHHSLPDFLACDEEAPEALRLLAGMAADDSDVAVRQMACTALTDLIGELMTRCGLWPIPKR
jgi:HEAT repeat protein